MKERSSRSDTSFVLLDENRQYLTSVLDSSFSMESQDIAKFLESQEEVNFSSSSYPVINKTRYFQIVTNANENGWSLLNLIPIALVFRNIISAALWGCLILIGVTVFAFFVCKYFARRLNSPVENLTRQLKEKGITPQSFSSGPKEFQMIVSALASLQENNKALRAMQDKSRYSLTQTFLYKLVTDHHMEAPILLK